MLSIRGAAELCAGVLVVIAATSSGCGGESDADLTMGNQGGASGSAGASGAAGASGKGGTGTPDAGGSAGKQDAGPEHDAAEASVEAGQDASSDVGPDIATDAPFKCSTSDDCPTLSELCQVPLCSSGNCTSAPAPEGTEVPTSAQKTGDCKKVTCGVGGTVTAIADTGDLPADDGNPCTDATCNGPNPAHVDSQTGIVCTPSVDPGASSGFCNGSGICGVCNPGTLDCEGTTSRSCDSTGAWKPAADCPYVCTGAGECTGVCKPGDADCAGLQTRICNATGEWAASGAPCQFVCQNGACTGSCVPASARCSGATPETCDQSGSWVPGVSCPFVCTGAGECTGVCVPGSKDCQGKQPRVCDDTGHWAASGSACPNVCSAGQCAGSCPPGTLQCSGKVPQSCNDAGIWVDAAACTHVCSNGACTGVCSPGDTRCSGTNLQSCDASGQWVSTTACPFICSNATCTGVCAPGTTRCVGTTSQTCDAAGSWQDTTTCAYVCLAGSCSGVCAPGATQCDGNSVRTCDQAGQWQVTGVCPYVCSNASCTGECTPGASRCNGLETQQCDASGQWKVISTCPFTCSAGSCTGTCIPGSKQCSGTNVQTCNAQGQWATTTTCPYVCSGTGDCTGVCVPGTNKCEGNTPQNCDLTGQWTGNTPCASQTCVSGTCQGECVAGSKQCIGNTPQSCSASGTWMSNPACVNQACVGGTCEGTCTPGTRQCSGNGFQLCDSNGQWGAPADCGSQACVAGTCQGECKPGTKQCTGDTPQLCDSMGKWTNGQPCSVGCCNGTCAPGLIAADAACALRADGTLWCWGDNRFGKLGIGDNSGQPCSGGMPCVPTPVQVQSLGSSVVQMDSGGCAVTSGGALWCWGYNAWGKVGDGTSVDRYSPLQVTSMGLGVAAISVGLPWQHACGIKQDKSIWCWGSNWQGQLGNSSTSGSYACALGGPCEFLPVQAPVAGKFARQISSGYYHNCAVMTDNSLWCWGSASAGELGDGTNTGQSCHNGQCWPYPRQVPAMGTGVSQVSAGGRFTCAVKLDGSLWCWGLNANGQLGDGTVTLNPNPAQVTALGTNVASVSAASGMTCAVTKGGKLWCWGYNGTGGLGDGTMEERHSPVQVTALGSDVATVTAAGSYACALKKNGTLWCWGNNGMGQLGDGTTTSSLVPVQVKVPMCN